MSKVTYYVNDKLGYLCSILEIPGWELLDGHYAFSSAADYQTALDNAYDTVWGMFLDDDPNNDDEAEEYDAMLTEVVGFTIMYWSTEKKNWYPVL